MFDYRSALWLFLSIGAIALFSFLSVVSWVDCRRREREALYRSEVLRKIADLPGATPEIVVAAMREQEGAVERRIREFIKAAGTITSAVGLGIVIFLRALGTGAVSLSGLIPFFVGIAMLSYVYMMAPRRH